MFTKKDIKKIDDFLKIKFKVVYNFKFNGLFLFYKSGLRKILMGEECEELDFVLLTQNKDNVIDFINKNKFVLISKSNNYYSFTYNNLKITISITNDLYDISSISSDMLFFDINRKQLIPIGLSYILNTNKINKYYKDNITSQEVKDSKKFISFLNNKKHVRLKRKYFILSKKYIPLNKQYFHNINPSNIQKTIKRYFSIIYDYNFNGIVFLMGGAIRNTIKNENVKDFDFVVLSQDKCEIKKFINKFKLNYKMNAMGGYKIFYNDFEIDIFSTNDLMHAARYNTDMLLYDINDNKFFVCGSIHSYNTRTIKEINTTKLPLFTDSLRIKKLKNFIKYITKNDRKVKVKQNLILWHYKMLLRMIKQMNFRIKYGNFRKCFKYLKDIKLKVIIDIILNLILNLLNLIIPILLTSFIFNIITKNYKSSINNIIIILSILSFSILINIIKNKITIKIKEKMRNKIIVRKKEYEKDSLIICDSFDIIKNILINGIVNLIAIIIVYFINIFLGLLYTISLCILYKIKINYMRKSVYLSDNGKQKIDNICNYIQNIFYYLSLFICVLLIKNENILIFDSILILLFKQQLFLFINKFDLFLIIRNDFNNSCKKIEL